MPTTLGTVHRPVWTEMNAVLVSERSPVGLGIGHGEGRRRRSRRSHTCGSPSRRCPSGRPRRPSSHAVPPAAEPSVNVIDIPGETSWRFAVNATSDVPMTVTSMCAVLRAVGIARRHGRRRTRRSALRTRMCGSAGPGRVEVPPSPKSHDQALGDPPEVSRNSTLNGDRSEIATAWAVRDDTTPFPVKAAFGAGWVPGRRRRRRHRSSPS